MTFLRDLWDVSIPGQRINAVKAQRAQAEQDKALFDAQQEQLARANATEDNELYRQALGRVARGIQSLEASGLERGAAFDQIAPRVGRALGSSPEEIAQAREFFVTNEDPYGAVAAALIDPTKKPDKPSAIQEYEYLKELGPADRELYLENRRGPKVVQTPAGVFQVVPGAQGARREVVSTGELASGERVISEGKSTGQTVGKSVIEDLDTRYGEAQSALSTLDMTSRAKTLLDEGIISGSLPGQRLALSRAMSTLTGKEMSPEAINTAEYRALVGKFVGEAITAFGAGTGLSDKDREFAEAMAGGDLAGGARALQSIMEIVEKQAQRKIDNYEKRRGTVVDRNSDYGDLYPSLAAPTTQSAEAVPEGVAPEDWEYMTPDERALFGGG